MARRKDPTGTAVVTVFQLTEHAAEGDVTRSVILPSLPGAVSSLPRAAAKEAISRGMRTIADKTFSVCLPGLPEYRIRAEEIRRDGDRLFDAEILIMAAEVLLSRYGSLIAEDLVRALINRSDAIREEVGK
jgi:hypothetical protein